METRNALQHRRGAPIGARTPDGSGGIANARTRCGRIANPAGRGLLSMCLTALLLFAVQGALAQHVSSSENVFTTIGYGEKPCMQVVNSSYNMEQNLNVYDVRINYAYYPDYYYYKKQLDKGNLLDVQLILIQQYLDAYYELLSRGAVNEWDGDVWLKLNGNDMLNLSTLTFRNASTGVGAQCFIGHAGYYMKPDNSNPSPPIWPWADELNNNYATNWEVSGSQASGLSNLTGVYVSLLNTKDYQVKDSRNRHFLVKTILVRIGIERTWQNKDLNLSLNGHWRFRIGDTGNPGDEYREYTLNTTLRSPSAPFPSSSGSLERKGNCTLLYTAPSVDQVKGKQLEVDGLYLGGLVDCDFVQHISLMTEDCSNSDQPMSIIKASYKRYGLLENVASGATHEFLVSDNYVPVTVYPCWELESKTPYTMSAIFNRGNMAYKQHHNKFMPALSVKGFPRPKEVNVVTVDVFTRKVSVSWDWEVYDPNNCDKAGKWYVFRRLGDDGETLKIGEVNNTSASTFTINYTPTGEAKPEYNTEYNYIVCFVPSGWEVNSEKDAKGLSKTKAFTVERSFSVSAPTVTADDSKITVSWEHSLLTDASSSNRYSFEVERSEDNDTWVTKYAGEVSDPSKTTGTWDDTDITSRKTYYYRVRFSSVQDVAWVSDATSIRSDGSDFVAGSFRASRGEYASTVKLTWQVRQVGTGECYFTLQRRPLGTIGDSGWADIYTTNGSSSTYSYEDLTAPVGSFNEYKLTISEKVDGKMVTGNSVITDGFCMATGTMSGRVSFGSGTAVDSVKVTMRANSSSGNRINRFRSLYFDGIANSTEGGTGMSYAGNTDELKKIFGGDFTVQMWINPSSDMNAHADSIPFFDIPNAVSLHVKKENSNSAKLVVGINDDNVTMSSQLYVDYDKWTNVVLTYQKSTGALTLYTLDGTTVQKATGTQSIEADRIEGAGGLFGLANLATRTSPLAYKGYIDEFRAFNIALTQGDIERNYNHPLVGSEDGLQVYYTFDEGIANQKFAYDFSKQNGISNGHHGTTNIIARSMTNIPDENQFGLLGYTDANGNYMIGGIGFSGDGTNYVATPTLGIHQFSPSNESRFFSMNSLVYTGVNFEDVSSFPVSGTVYYSHSTIPVKDVYIKVDGITASRDGKPVQTNERGEFTVDVPIGKHFISLDKTGHTFERGGRYPEDAFGTGVRTDFDNAVSGLLFYDNTTVAVAGRVAGGDIEHDKPLGLDAGKANIGRATLRLEQENSTGWLSAVRNATGNYDLCPTDSTLRTQSGTAVIPASQNHIIVKTNPTTGEWVAQLPPLRYKVASVSIDSNDAITFDANNLPVIDATNPNMIYTDSIKSETGEVRKFEYVGSAKIEYKSPSTLDVKENEDGSYGMKDYTMKDIQGNEHKVDLYTVGADGKVHYAFGVENIGDEDNAVYYGADDLTHTGYPVYEELSTYTYKIYAYERYVNKDGDEDVIDEVPLIGKKVTIQNQFASSAKIYCEAPDGSGHEVGDVYELEKNTFELDSLGCGTYQFTVGYPNIQKPYTRGLTITYGDEGNEMSWSGNATFKAFILGSLPSGNNFVTQGPDEILMVLRDPPGTGSSASWTQGTTTTSTRNITVEPHSNTVLNSSIYAGVKQETGEGIGFMVIQDLDSKATITAGAEVNLSYSNLKTKTTTVTTTKDISTSADFDFNGPDGDLFIGTAKNLLFGATRLVDMKWDEVSQKPLLFMEEALATGEEFTTGFAYTQNHVKSTLIPNFKKLRDSLLVQVNSYEGLPRPEEGNDPTYYTKLRPGDAGYGTSNNDESVWGDQAVPFSALDNETGLYIGPSYAMVLPLNWEMDTLGIQDMVNFYNLQIQRWERQLYLNEEAKVTAIENSKEWLKENHSFDAGGSITVTTTNTKTHSEVHTGVEEVNVIVGVETGYRFSGLGLGVEISEKVGVTVTEQFQDDDTKETTFSYTLAENGDGDYLSVDVFEAPDGFGPIFYTRAGATSCPYQGKVLTEYYEPGEKVIMESTVQIERPEIEAAPQSLTGIPSGGVGTFQVSIRNNSDTKADGWYDIMVVSKSNPDGLVVKMDGLNITTGRSILVEAGTTMKKTFTVEQSNPDVLSYSDVIIRIASQCQKDNTGVYPEIADSTIISVYFQPSCSDVQLAASHSLVNNDTDTKQTLSISGYNHSMKSLKGIRLQYKGLNDANFTTLQEYSKDEDRVEADPNLLLLPALNGTDKLDFVIDLRDNAYTDQTYVFRAVTVCEQNGKEVNNESDEVTIIRDLSSPQLMATPSPMSGILTSGDNLMLTFNEDIQGGKLTKPNNFEVVGVLNESEVTHDVALSLTGGNAAKTEGTIDLSGKSFSTSLWLNYSSGGTLLQHGTADNCFNVSIDDGKLAVKVGDGDAVTSTASLPPDSWIYLNIAYNAETSQVSAGYALDASEVTLLNQVSVPAYEGNGPVSLGGNGLTAKVQELAIWNEARSMSQAQADMYTTKSQFTSGLMSYWQMNEGRGDVAADRARSRNMTLPSQNAWWINGDNYAVVLDGTKAAAANIGTLNTTASESYLLEAWFKADEQQNGVATILSTQVMDLRLNAEGKMEMAVGEGSTAAATAILNQDLRDGQWHHVAVNVLKNSNGSGIVYVDGQQRKQLSASAMPVLYGEQLTLGARKQENIATYYDQLLKGAVDEVRIWKGNRTADIIKNNMYQRLKGDEAGLVAYYPMENTALDTYNQMVTTASLGDKVAKGTTLAFFDADANNADGSTSKDNTAALKQAPKTENVQFSFVASERQITVNLEELPAKIEGCNIYITAKNVKDMNGNSAQPITWSVFVQQNNLTWQENSIDVTKEGNDEPAFTATIENRSSQSESWSLNGLPSWLSANVDGGVIAPLSSANLTFTVAGSLPIGTYETTVYMTGSQNINAPLYVTVNSEGDAPDWVATPGECTMTIVGVLNIDGVQSNDPKDMVAAFRGQECVGVASPKYFSRYDSYIVMMNIYGNEEAALTYKAYDASTGTVYPSVNVLDTDGDPYTFGIDKALGSFTAPVTFSPLNEIEQDLSMDHKGWKWFSLHAMPKNPAVSVMFKDASSAISAVTNGSNSVIATNSNGSVNWSGEMAVNNPAIMYKLNATEPYVETIIGAPTDPTAIDITLTSGWTWIGYPAQASNTLTAAFASIDPQENDMVKNQSAFSIFTNGDWVGTLTAMVPGEGYLYYSGASAEKTFHFPKPTVSGHSNTPRHAAAQLSRLCQDNMTMVAVVQRGDDMVEDAQVSVYANGELRAFSAKAVADGLHFLTIGGQRGEDELLTFVVQTDDGEFLLTQTDIFNADAKRGTPDKPVILQLDKSTGIDTAISDVDIRSIMLYDAAGRVVRSAERPSRLYTKGDLKQMPAGIYYQQVTYSNGMTRVQKIMR